jgi:hypothetical protein
MLRTKLFTALGIWLIQLSTAHGSTLVRGENRTCRDFADLDYALDHPSSAYFKGWTSKDFDAAQEWVASCFASPPSHGDTERQSLLVQRRAALEARGEIQRNDEIINNMREAELREQRTKEAELASQEAARRAEEEKALADRKARQAARDECLSSNSYQRYLAETHILEALGRESAAQGALARERRVEEVSDTTNLYTKHNAGESLVAAQDDLQKWWAAYRRYGGEAKTPESISLSVRNPCN